MSAMAAAARFMCGCGGGGEEAVIARSVSSEAIQFLLVAPGLLRSQ